MAVDALKWRMEPKSCERSHWLTAPDALPLSLAQIQVGARCKLEPHTTFGEEGEGAFLNRILPLLQNCLSRKKQRMHVFSHCST
ncbi:uncharacterized protein LOC144025576 isoform X2 [Festucalex cinctus]